MDDKGREIVFNLIEENKRLLADNDRLGEMVCEQREKYESASSENSDLRKIVNVSREVMDLLNGEEISRLFNVWNDWSEKNETVSTRQESK